MKAPGFQWYVAWRYLLARPMRVSGVLLVFLAICTWVLAAMQGAVALYPLTDILYIPPPNPPLALVVLEVAGLSGALVSVGCAYVILYLTLFAYLHGDRRACEVWIQRLGMVLVTAVYAGAVGVAAAAIIRELRELPFDGEHWALALSDAQWIVISILVVGAQVTTWFLAGARVRSTEALFWLAGALVFALRAFAHSDPSSAAWIGMVAGIVGLLALVLVAIYGVPTRQLRFNASLFWSTAAMCSGVGAAILVFAINGLAGPVGPSGAVILGSIALCVVGILIAIVYGQRSREGARIGLYVVLLGLILLVAAPLVDAALEDFAVVEKGVSIVGGFSTAKVPMWMIISSGVAGALAGLTLILVAIRYVFTFFTTVSVGGVAIGTMALVQVLSVMAGFESDLREKILGSNAHILVTRGDEVQFEGYDEVMRRIENVSGVVAATPYLLSEVVIAANNNYANVIIKGVDPETVGDATELSQNLEEGDEEALQKLWPLADDGSIIGKPERAPPPEPEPEPEPEPGDGEGEPVVDPAPDDMFVPEYVEPTDFSGDDEPAPTDFSGDGDEGDEGDEPAPIDFSGDGDDGDEPAPIDFSGDGDEDEDEDGEPVDAPDFSGDAGPTDPKVGGADLEDMIDDLDGGAGFSEDPLTPDEAYEAVRDYIPPHVARLPGVLVGRELVNQLTLYTGEEVKVISPLGQDTPMGPVPRTKPYRVAGRFYTGMYEYDLKYIYVSLESLQEFLDLGDEVNGIEIRVSDPDRSAAVARSLSKVLGSDYEVQDWRQINRSLFSALKLEKVAMFLVLVIIVLVASFSIVGNLIMVVVDKSKEIAIIKTLGASDGAVMKIFIIQGFFIGLVGTGIGLALGLLSCWLGQTFGLPLDPDVYYIDQLPIHVEPTSIVAVALAGIAISVVATIYPAFVAALMRPVKGFRLG